MFNPTGKKPNLKKLREINPKPVALPVGDVVKRYYLKQDQALPLVIEPATDFVDLLSWCSANRASIEQSLSQHGAILFRHFKVHSPVDFQDFIRTVSGEALEYKERSSPRSSVFGQIYTSTDYPQDQTIFLHNENSYAHSWPLKIFFFCDTPAVTGGETPIADVRKVYRRIDPEISRKFEEKGVMYVRNFGSAIGLHWQDVFQTGDRLQAERFCRERGYQIEWREENRLRTRRIGQAVTAHPKTGELIWFNHAAFFHISTMGEEICKALLSQYAEEELPNNTYYGDGSAIEPHVLNHLRDAYWNEAQFFRWEKGDVLMLDNMLVAHGRAPFTGPRRILVGMSELFTCDDTGARACQCVKGEDEITQ